jgi:hypothetical protein
VVVEGVGDDMSPIQVAQVVFAILACLCFLADFFGKRPGAGWLGMTFLTISLFIPLVA